MASSIPPNVRFTLLSLRDLAVSVGPFAVLAAGLLALAFFWLDPTPPRSVLLATGPPQSAYEEFGKRYARALAKNGIEVLLLPTEGSAANVQLLHEGRVDFGFVQGGSAAPARAMPDGAAPETAAPANKSEPAPLVSLGSLFLEPVWLFYRAPQALTSVTQLQGLRVNVGTPGSGLPNLMAKLLESNRVESGAVRLSQLGPTPAVVAFLGGELDAIVFASAPESLMVQMLLQTPGVRLMDFAQSEAYSRRFDFLSASTLPRGVVDLAGDLPAQDVHLVAPTTTLLARQDTHPALLQLFALAGRDIHGGAGWFKHAREYPNVRFNELPLAKEAERSIQEGPPLLQRYLPFWLANVIERMWLVMGILLAVLLPLSRIVPPLYAFRVRSRIFRWYAQLRRIEERSLQSPPPPALQDELDALEAHAQNTVVPLSYADELYALRSNIALVRARLTEKS